MCHPPLIHSSLRLLRTSPTARLSPSSTRPPPPTHHRYYTRNVPCIIHKQKYSVQNRARLSPTARFVRETQSESLARGVVTLFALEGRGLSRARNPSSSNRYVADSTGTRIDFEGSFDPESCSCPRRPTRLRAQPRVSPTSVPIRFQIFGCVSMYTPTPPLF